MKSAAQQALIDLRQSLGLTQHALAKALNVTPVTVSRWETSRSPTGMSAAHLARFAQQNGDIKKGAILAEQADAIRPLSSAQAFKAHAEVIKARHVIWEKAFLAAITGILASGPDTPESIAADAKRVADQAADLYIKTWGSAGEISPQGGET